MAEPYLDHEAVQSGAKDAIVIVSIDELWGCRCLLCLHSVDDTLYTRSPGYKLSTQRLYLHAECGYYVS